MPDKQETVAYLGPQASYTHQATLDRFPELDYKLAPQTTIEDVFAAVQSGSADQGVVPFENSSNGSVDFTLDLFANQEGKYSDIMVCGEIYLPVHHCLLGHASNSSFDNKSTNGPNENDGTKAPAIPLYDLSKIKTLYSHPQAWGQCNIFLSKYLKGIDRQNVSSTSKAAELVAQDTTGTSAAISSRVAGDLNGLEMLAENIEDKAGNTTRFFVLRRNDSQTTAVQNTATNAAGEELRYKTLVSFTVSHSESGALADCLAVFKKYRLNLTSINSRPSNESTWHYIFFVEFVGQKLEDGQGGAVNQALRELDGVAQGWRWLGSWQNALAG